MNSLKSFDWRSLQKYFSPKATADLNSFLEHLPQTAGHTVLVAAGIAWSAAAAIGLYATVETTKLIELRAELASTETLQPVVPQIRDKPVGPGEIKDFADQMARIYRGLQIRPQGAAMYITAQNTTSFGEFREAIGHVQNGGSGWRVSMERLCVGRECDREKLAALLKISKVTVEAPSQ